MYHFITGLFLGEMANCFILLQFYKKLNLENDQNSNLSIMV